MKKFNALQLLWPVLLILASCEKEEGLWQLPPAGPETVASVNLGANYQNSIFFQLSTGKWVIRDHEAWDLAFSSVDSGWHIMINGGKEIQVALTDETDFSRLPQMPDKSQWRWDNPNQHPDSSAIGCWKDTAFGHRKRIFIIDLGPTAAPMRFAKLQLLSVNDSAYTFRFGDVSAKDAPITTLKKDKNCNYTYFNAQIADIVAYEPIATDWDIQFTRYRYVYYNMNPITPYQVNGVLSNTTVTQVAETTNIKFEDIDASLATSLTYSNAADVIGFDWKYYDLNGSGKYTVNSKKTFLIKHSSGTIYKLKFIDFYDDQGRKGVPKFVYQRL